MVAKNDWETSDVYSATDANDLANEVNGKADAVHEHVLADVTDVTATAAEVNLLDGVTATTAELNYVDGVTSNVQMQLDGKAATSHNHSAADITSGTLAIARIPTGSTSSTVCVGNDSRLSNQRTPLDNSVTASKIVAGAITNTEINVGANIAASKLSSAAQTSLGKADTAVQPGAAGSVVVGTLPGSGVTGVLYVVP